LHVEAVLGIRTLEPAQLAALPPLWQGADAPAVTALATLDRELLLVLEAARLLPDDGSIYQREGSG
jgi:chemotaxis signal transduction protein